MTTTPSPKITSDLIARFGELVGGADLWRTLGLKSERTFQRLVKERRVPVITFTVAGRRGLMARTRDVGAWLESLGCEGTQRIDAGGEPPGN